LIREACWREERLTLNYTDEHGADTERTILPLALVYTEQRSVVLAWCLLREAFRMFRLDRIRDARTGAGSFRPRRASLLRAYLEQLRQEEASPATSHGPHDR
jgi:predicted DNA-binding transcriptional regulator YafY